MSDVDDAVDALREMGEHAQAGRNAEAVAAAEEVLQLARKVDNPRAKGLLVASATSTWLTSKAVLDPSDSDLLSRCDRIFERFSEFSFEGAATTAIIALGVKIQLLLQARQPKEAEQISGDLATFYSARPAGPKLAEEGAEVVRIASNMVAMRAPTPAVSLARTVVDQLAGGATREEALLAATAQAWVVIAAMFTGEPVPGIPAAQNAEELRSLLDSDDLPGLAQGGKDTDRLIAMGDTAIEAGEALRERLRQYGPEWDRARIMLSTIKIATLQELGRRDEFRAAEQAFVDEFLDSDDWCVDGVAQWYQHDLQQP